MPLKGVKVLEFCGLAPGPFCGKILSDFGATVTVIDKVSNNPLNTFKIGKRLLPVNLKDAKGQRLIRDLSKHYDVLLEPFRPGVMEKLNLGPEILCKDNPRLIYARLTGFGQTGRLAPRAGHDLNYVAVSGILSFLGRKGQKPTAPVNLLADFAGGGFLCAMGICLALLERHNSGRGQVIDSSMAEGAAYVASWLFSSQKLPIWSGNGRGTNILDTGAFYYDTYETKDGKFMSVAALEPQFFDKFVETLGVRELNQFSSNEEAKDLVTKVFLTKTQDEWARIFEDIDACVYPVMEWRYAPDHDHNKARKAFIKYADGDLIPKPAPVLSRTPGQIRNTRKLDAFEEAVEILSDAGRSLSDVQQLVEEGVLLIASKSKM